MTDAETDLLRGVLDASGGVEPWRALSSISVVIDYGGGFWAFKGQPGFVGPTRVDLRVQREHIRQRHETTGVATEYDKTLDRVDVTDAAGATRSLEHPRQSLAGAVRSTPWDVLQAAYFRGYATWHYLVEPYLFVMPGVKTREVEPWTEDGARWRVLEATFPPTIDTHNTTQRYYFDDRFHLRRMDYEPEITGYAPAAHYIFAETVVHGIVIPTKRAVHPRNPDGTPDTGVATITLALSDIRLGWSHTSNERRVT